MSVFLSRQWRHRQGPARLRTLILLHGSHGFAREYVQLARNLADSGIRAIAACWFSGSSGSAGLRFVTSIACQQAPPISMAASEQALGSIDVLLQAARQLPNARADRIALFGHSRGGGAALNYILKYTGVCGAILNSTGYPPGVVAAAAQVHAPILILHGTADRPDNGGSKVTSVTMARHFEEAVRRAGKPISAHYYDGAGHNELFSSVAQRNDVVDRRNLCARSADAGSVTAGGDESHHGNVGVTVT